MHTLITNIKSLVQVREQSVKKVAGADMAQLPTIDDAYLLIEDDKIKAYGSMREMPGIEAENVIDGSGKLVLPAFVDSHTHIIFPAYREDEFVDKIRGVSYAEIAAKGGGILNSAQKTALASEDELFESAMVRIREVISQGTAALEIKSGYGLSVEGELKMLRVARRIKEHIPIPVKTTFLGAHAIPKKYEHRADYIDLVIHEMLPRVAAEGLADYCDVFCETGFFTRKETEKILNRAISLGMKAKVHANQLNRSGGVQAGVNVGAISVDHLETMGHEEIEVLKNSNTMPTLLPGAAFFLRMSMPPARELIGAGLPVSLATDYNPGSAPCGRMSTMLSLACIQMKMSPEEAINAATINAAYAMDVNDVMGSITAGKKANLIITKKIPSLAYIPYAFGTDSIEEVLINGKTFKPEDI